MRVWNRKNVIIDKKRFNGTAALNGTLANSAVVDNSDGTVGIVITGHGLVAGDIIIISGTTNYDGVHEIQSVEDVNTVNITATYVAETPAGSETYALYFKPSGVKAWKLCEARFTLSATGGASENYTVTIDHGAGASFDCTLDSQDMNAVAYHFTDFTELIGFLESTDALTFGYTNTNGRTWGLEIVYEVLLN